MHQSKVYETPVEKLSSVMSHDWPHPFLSGGEAARFKRPAGPQRAPSSAAGRRSGGKSTTNTAQPIRTLFTCFVVCYFLLKLLNIVILLFVGNFIRFFGV